MDHDKRQDGLDVGADVNWVITTGKETAVEMEESLQSRARHLYQVEGLSLTQTGRKLGISRKKVTRLIRQDDLQRKPAEGVIAPYERLIQQWYKEYPFLKAIQVLERLKSYGYEGGYTAVTEYTLQFRKTRKRIAYHALEFLPGEEAQVDWMQRTMPFGVVYGFVYILSYSRYLYCRFSMRSSLEFFLDGHIEALKEIKGIVSRHTYDNLKSVVISRKPEITYNARFLDFARHYGFSIRACNPGKPNEKGRVERVIRDIESFLAVNTFSDIADLNRRVGQWRVQRNTRIHRSLGITPSEALKQEKLRGLPQIHYLAYRHVPAAISKTCLVEFDTNRYSVPSQYSDMPCDIFAYTHQIEVLVNGRKVATHNRVFDRKQKIEHPSHRQRLLDKTPHFKHQRILQLLKSMDSNIEHFIKRAEQEGQDPLSVSYELFKLLKGIAKETLISAVKAAISIDTYRVTYIQGLLSPAGNQDNPVHPQNHGLLHITYEGRQLSDYDELI
jgi:transposase